MYTSYIISYQGKVYMRSILEKYKVVEIYYFQMCFLLSENICNPYFKDYRFFLKIVKKENYYAIKITAKFWINWNNLFKMKIEIRLPPILASVKLTIDRSPKILFFQSSTLTEHLHFNNCLTKPIVRSTSIYFLTIYLQVCQGPYKRWIPFLELSWWNLSLFPELHTHYTSFSLRTSHKVQQGKKKRADY